MKAPCYRYKSVQGPAALETETRLDIRFMP